MIQARELVKKFGEVTAVAGISFDVAPAEMTAPERRQPDDAEARPDKRVAQDPRGEQIAEPPEHARTDHVALVLGQQEPLRPFARVHVEMVEPEDGQNFLQLPHVIEVACESFFQAFYRLVRLWPCGRNCTHTQIRPVGGDQAKPLL